MKRLNKQILMHALCILLCGASFAQENNSIFKKLDIDASLKINHSLMERFISPNPPQELIIFFRDEGLDNNSVESSKIRFFQNFVDSEIKIIDFSPGTNRALIKLIDINSILKILNQKSVKSVFENGQSSRSLVESLSLINQPLAYQTGNIGNGASVAIIDAGVDFSEEQFGKCSSPGIPAGCRVKASVLFNRNSNGGPYTPDPNGKHGTNVASIVAATAPGADLILINAASMAGTPAEPIITFYDSDILKSIDWIIANKKTYNIVSVNMSLTKLGPNQTVLSGYQGDCANSIFTDGFKKLRDAGILPVVANGNDAKSFNLDLQGGINGVGEPACVPGAIAVGAVTDGPGEGYFGSFCRGQITSADQIACFSQTSARTTLLAPGTNITAGYLSNKPGNPPITLSGTSMAAPFVSGAIAILRAPGAAPNETLDETVFRLTSSGKNITDTRFGLNNLTKPRIDILAALGELGTQPKPQPQPQPTNIEAGSLVGPITYIVN